MGSGCRVSINLGIINTKNGTVTKAIIEYTEQSFAFCSVWSIEDLNEKYAP
jgi:hypothetical protein